MRNIWKRTRGRRWLPGCLAVLLSACDLINPEEAIPAYVRIDAVDYVGDAAYADHQIVDAWVFADGVYIGAFELPATFPVLSEGPTELEVRPGILTDGLRGSRQPYPFYQNYTQTVDLVPGEETVLRPTTRYTFASTLVLSEDFEDTTVTISASNNSGFPLVVSDTLPPSAGGTLAGLIQTTAADSLGILEAVATEGLTIENEQFVFLELTFRASARVQIGLYATLNGQVASLQDLTLFPTDAWKKVYVNLTEEANSVVGTASLQPFVRTLSDTGTADYLAIDNVRLIYGR